MDMPEDIPVKFVLNLNVPQAKERTGNLSWPSQGHGPMVPVRFYLLAVAVCQIPSANFPHLPRGLFTCLCIVFGNSLAKEAVPICS